MSIKIGGIDLADGVIDAQFRIGIMEKVIDRLLKAAPPGTLSEGDMEMIRNETMRELPPKYPSAGISRQ